ncbi:DEAD/DEAH box helicase [Angustibacter luteus]|uniref:DEAD/DEAH box helicase n=1 Tax=Angustibacter luteus TaxID=658456 RepID=A0ABW1JDE2_9ACTN
MSTPGQQPSMLDVVRASGLRADRVRHIEHLERRAAEYADWPDWADPLVVSAFQLGGVLRPWRHQVQAADLVHAGQHTVLATGTASGKSLGYLLPALTAVLDDAGRGLAVRRPTVLYLAPTKALAADQLARLEALQLPGLRAATYDGDTAPEERRWVRDHASFVLTNPDLLHHSLLPGHERWARFLRGLRVVVVDESHHYRGVFGSHVATVLRRLRRVAERYGSAPTFVLASATVSSPAEHASRLVGLPVRAVTDDASPRGRTDVVLWEPPLLPGGGEHEAPTRRSAQAETADLLTDLTSRGVRTLAFVRSRRGVEQVAATTRRLLGEVDPELADRVAAYRGGYLPEERRALEGDLRSGRLLGLAATNALELGVDIAGLDAVLMAGWPGRRASMWQQVGRAGREGQDALAVLVAADDPLDTYLVQHPAAVFGTPLEATVLDPDNPYVLAPHLAAAAAELPLTEDDLVLFGPSARGVLDVLVAQGVLRRRPGGWFWPRSDRATARTDLRGTGGSTVRVVEEETGRVLGTVDAGAADRTVHDGSVYVHQGDTFVVRRLDLEQHLALVERSAPPWTTHARSLSDVRLLETLQRREWGDVEVCFGVVRVTSQVVSFLRRRLVTGEVLGEQPLDLPPRDLVTKAVWWHTSSQALAGCGLEAPDVPGALHAAEHAAIGLLPLLATCDRWDVGGVSTALHPDTGRPTVVVHDGHPGGAGFAERGFAVMRDWIQATHDAVQGCACETGCPSCVQSPKCGNGNEPLDKRGALRVLSMLLRASADGG